MRINSKNPGLVMRLYGMFHLTGLSFPTLTELSGKVLNLSSMRFVESNIQTSFDERWLVGSEVVNNQIQN